MDRFGKYVGIPWANRGRDPAAGMDCWGLIWHVLRSELGVEIPSYSDEYDDSDVSPVDAIALHKRAPWLEVPHERSHGVLTISGLSDVRVGDVVELLLAGSLWHVGLVVGPGQMLHSREKAGSVRENFLAGGWNHRVRGFWRWSKC